MLRCKTTIYCARVTDTNKTLLWCYLHPQWPKTNCKSAPVLRACLRGGGGPQVGDVILCETFTRQNLTLAEDYPLWQMAAHFSYYVNIMKLFIRDLEQWIQNSIFSVFSGRLCKNTAIIYATRDDLNLGGEETRAFQRYKPVVFILREVKCLLQWDSLSFKHNTVTSIPPFSAVYS